jgi:hypothetical protein
MLKGKSQLGALEEVGIDSEKFSGFVFGLVWDLSGGGDFS